MPTPCFYGLLGGVLIAGLKFIEYRWLLIEHSIEIYGGMVAAVFASLGIWLGLKPTKTHETVVVREVPVPVSGPFTRNEARLVELAVTPRDLEPLPVGVVFTLVTAGVLGRKRGAERAAA